MHFWIVTYYQYPKLKTMEIRCDFWNVANECSVKGVMVDSIISVQRKPEES